MMKMMMMLTVALLFLMAGTAFAEGSTQGTRAQRAKDCCRMKQEVLAPRASEGGKLALCTKAQSAKMTHMMKRMRMRGGTLYDRGSHRVNRQITGRGVARQDGSAIYPKEGAQCRMGMGDACPHQQTGGNRGKQAVEGKRMMQHSPMREKMQHRGHDACPFCAENQAPPAK